MMALEEAPQHVGLDRAEIDRHERMRDDREAVLVVDRRDSVFERHPALDRLIEEPRQHVRRGRPLRRDLLARNDDQPGALTALLHLFDARHGVVIGDRDQVDVRLDRGFDQLSRRDHTVRRDGVAMRVGDGHRSGLEH